MDDYRSAVISFLGGKCVNCNSKQNLVLHHRFYPEGITKNGYGNEVGTPRMWAYAKAGTYLLLCSNCHHLLHKKLNFQSKLNKHLSGNNQGPKTP